MSEVAGSVSQQRAAAIVPIRPDDRAAVLTIAGHSVLDRTIRTLRAVPRIGAIVLAIEGPRESEYLAAIEEPEQLDITVATSSGNRWQAIEAALRLVQSGSVVLAAPDRPLVSPAAIVELLELLERSSGTAATVTAMPVASSIKRVVDGQVVATVPRERLRLIQGPWVFDRATLVAAVRRAIAERWPATDELDLVQAAGISVRLAEGHRFNVPIASRADARFAEMALARALVEVPGVEAVPA